MSARGSRQAGISQRSQSLPAIAMPPLLMKPSLTNADECLLVNTEQSDRVGGWRVGEVVLEGRAFIWPPPPPPPLHARCFEEDKHSCINPVIVADRPEEIRPCDEENLYFKKIK